MQADRPPRAPSGARPRRRDRHGRGLRGSLAPIAIPRQRTPAEQFDDLVLEAVAELEGRWADELAAVEFAVEDVPGAPQTADTFDADVVVDRGVPLGRLVREPQPVVVVYRRPVEARAAGGDDRADLVFAVVAELLAEFLGRDIDEIDPPD